MWDTTRPTLLVTGFGPFGPVADNPTARLIAHMDAEGEAFCPDARLVTAVLPTSYRRAAETFETLLTEHRPLGVLSFGVATKADKIRLERFAQNLDDADLPDIDGKQLQGRPIVPHGPAALAATAPLDRLLAGLLEADIPAGFSNHAGNFVCNHLYYYALHRLSQLDPMPWMGFVHVPALGDALSEDTLLRAGRLLTHRLARSIGEGMRVR